jgi:hypothetical protein
MSMLREVIPLQILSEIKEVLQLQSLGLQDHRLPSHQAMLVTLLPNHKFQDQQNKPLLKNNKLQLDPHLWLKELKTPSL